MVEERSSGSQIKGIFKHILFSRLQTVQHSLETIGCFVSHNDHYVEKVFQILSLKRISSFFHNHKKGTSMNHLQLCKITCHSTQCYSAPPSVGSRAGSLVGDGDGDGETGVLSMKLHLLGMAPGRGRGRGRGNKSSMNFSFQRFCVWQMCHLILFSSGEWSSEKSFNGYDWNTLFYSIAIWNSIDIQYIQHLKWNFYFNTKSIICLMFLSSLIL